MDVPVDDETRQRLESLAKANGVPEENVDQFAAQLLGNAVTEQLADVGVQAISQQAEAQQAMEQETEES